MSLKEDKSNYLRRLRRSSALDEMPIPSSMATEPGSGTLVSEKYSHIIERVTRDPLLRPVANDR